MTQHNNWKDTGRPQIEYHILSIVRLSNIKDNATTYASASSASLQREDHLNKIYDFIDTLLIERTKACASIARDGKMIDDKYNPIVPIYNHACEYIATQITKLIETEE